MTVPPQTSSSVDVPAPLTSYDSRGALLRDQAAALAALYRADRSAGSWLVPAVAVAVVGLGLFLAGFAFGEAASSVTDRTGNVVLGIAALLVALPWPLRVLTRQWRLGHTRERAFEAWADVDMNLDARALPTGHIAADSRTAWDARDDDDFEEVAALRLAAAQAAITSGGLVVRAVLSGVLLLVGLALVLVAVTSTDEPWVVTGAGLGGLIMLVAGAAGAYAAIRRGLAAQRRLHVLADETALLRAQRQLAGVRPSQPSEQGSPLAARVTVSLLGLAIAALLVVRIVAAEPFVIVLVIVVLLCLAGAAAAGILRVRRRDRRLADVATTQGVLGAVGGSGGPVPPAATAQVPSQPAALVVAPDRLRVGGPSDEQRWVPTSAVRGATCTQRNSPFGARTVGVLVGDGSWLLLRTTAGADALDLLRSAGVRVVD